MQNFLKFKTRDNSTELRKFGEEYYLRESQLWKPFRLFGIFATFAAITFSVAAIFNDHWIDGKGFHAGTWEYCYHNFSDYEAVAKCPEKRPNWQNAVLGLMIFSASFGFIASMLSLCGLCTSPLPRKIYYFHSAGEIFLICAFITSTALIIYPIAIEIDHSISTHRYGVGYGLGWGGAFFFLAASVCMSLDDIIREASRAKCCRLCFKKSKPGDRSELQRV